MNAIRRWSSNSATWKTREATEQDEKWDERPGSSVLWQCIHSMDHGHQLSITATSDHRGVWDCAVCTVPDMIPKVCRLEQSGLGKGSWQVESSERTRVWRPMSVRTHTDRLPGSLSRFSWEPTVSHHQGHYEKTDGTASQHPFSLCGPSLCAWCMPPESNIKYYSSVAFIWEKCADAPDIY